MQTWEYKLITSKDFDAGVFNPANRKALEAGLNQLGKEGWEMVSADFNDDLMPTIRFSAVFKRPLGG